MTILFITKLLPYPLDSGGKVRTYRILKMLSTFHSIHFISFVDQENDKIWEKEISPLCSSIKTFVQPVVNNAHAHLKLKFLYSCILSTPFTVYKYYSPEIVDYIKQVIQRQKIEALFVDYLAMAQYIPPGFNGRIYCDEHDVSYLAFSTYAQREENVFLKAIYAFESKKLKKYESSLVTRFDHVFAISELDRERLIEIGAHPRRVSFLPTPFSSPLLYKGGNEKIILFTGLLSWLPNEKAIYWFIREIFPLVQKEIPHARFVIAGKNGENIQKYIQSLQNRSVEYLGYVESLKRLYKQTSVFVAPIQMGGGVRIKLLEALSVGLPVVSTSIGAEGIDVENGRHILLADSPDTFARAVVSILKNKRIGATLSHEGYACIRKNYSRLQAERVLQKTVSRQ